ncbi:hypothetical protein M422DRAFT_28159 [Sphaerobolus stellatus SS14]|nr:hypothetical protein M422DRAFT_28159 [Sphaerobolus stellatus SS14]
MLIAHAASTCDVCLENYSEDFSYHSIPCGHVFCLPCLINTDPPRCPLCRHDYSQYNIRKIHLTAPSARDVEARNLELKLVQSSPDMTLAESFELFQEVEDLLQGGPPEEFVVLRAFAAVLCEFHETKDKLREVNERATQSHATAEETIMELRQQLEQAAESVGNAVPDENAVPPDIDDYRTKLRTAELELLELRAECSSLRAETAKYQEQEDQERRSYESLRSQYRTANHELNDLRVQCVALQTQAQKQSRNEDMLRMQLESQRRERKTLVAECQRYYHDYIALMENNAQAHHQAVIKAREEYSANAIASRRRSNPLPPPPQPISLNSLKLGNPGTSLADKGKGKDGMDHTGEDPMSSAYVPTLAASIAVAGPSKHADSDSEVTTLLYKAPARMPLWPGSSKAESSSKAVNADRSSKLLDAGAIAERIERHQPIHIDYAYPQLQTHEKGSNELPPSPGPSKLRSRVDSQQASMAPQPSWYELSFSSHALGPPASRRSTVHARSSRRASSPVVSLSSQNQREYGQKSHRDHPDGGAGNMFHPTYFAAGSSTRENPSASNRESFPTGDPSMSQPPEPSMSKIPRRSRHDSYDYFGPSQSSQQYAASQAGPSRGQSELHGSFLPPRQRRETTYSYPHPAGPSSSTTWLNNNTERSVIQASREV